MNNDQNIAGGGTGEPLKWIPFGALAMILISASVFWKIEKSQVAPLKPAAEMGAPQAGGETPADGKDPGPPPMRGKTAPDFTLPTLDGGVMKLAEHKGKLIFLNIWASWCAPCREEMPSMQRLAGKLKGANFAMLTISIDKNKEDAAKFVKELNLTFPVALDPDQKVAPLYKITGVPETYIISPEGVVTHHLIGPGKWDDPAIIRAFSNQ